MSGRVTSACLGGALATLLAAAPAQALDGLPSGIPAAAKRAEPKLPKPRGWPFREGFSRTSGTGRLQGGAMLWTDFLYDDHGAVGSGSSSSPSSLAASDGTYRYPPGPAAGNGADVFRTAIGLTRRHSWWRVDWTTLVQPTIPIAAFALDTDDSTATGASEWPGVPGLRSPGVDRVLLVSGRGAWLLDPSGARRRAGRLIVDRRARSFLVRLPRRVLPPSGRWKVRLAAGLATPAGDGFAPVTGDDGAREGQPPVYNVSFRRRAQEPQADNYWMEDAQAAALADGDVSRFARVVRWRSLARRRTTPEPRPRGYLNRWYVTSLELGQGVVQDESPAGDLRPNFPGRLQPYAVYVPRSHRPRRRSRLIWLLHSLSVQHNQYGALNPGFVRRLCEQRATICATTLGRGPDGWYVDEAELDFFEVWGALARAYRLDPERTVVGGYSMGGFAAYRLGLGYPDLFSQAISLAGPPGAGLRVARGVGFDAGARRVDTTPLVENARWLPYLILHGALDQLVPVTSVVEQADEFDRLGYRYRFELYPAEDHLAWAAEGGFRSVPGWVERFRRVRNPGHVTFSWYPALSNRKWGIGPTGAWWVRRLRARSGKGMQLARVEARSLARPDPKVTSEASYGKVVDEGGAGEPNGLAAVMGEPGQRIASLVPEAASGGDPSIATRFERTWKLGVRSQRRRRAEIELANVAALTVQTRRAGRRRREGLALVVDSDGPVALTLAQLGARQRVKVDGGKPVRASRSGRVTLRIGAGRHAVTVQPWRGRRTPGRR